MGFRVLGPLEIVGFDGLFRLGSAELRSVLALLRIHADEAVAASRLVRGSVRGSGHILTIILRASRASRSQDLEAVQQSDVRKSVVDDLAHFRSVAPHRWSTSQERAHPPVRESARSWRCSSRSQTRMCRDHRLGTCRLALTEHALLCDALPVSCVQRLW